MFQITIIDKKYSKLIDAPASLVSLLNKNNKLIKDTFIETELVQLIHEHFPNVMISRLSRKAEIKRYRISETLQSMFNEVKELPLIPSETKLVDSFYDHATRHAGLSRRQFTTLAALIRCCTAKTKEIIENIKNSVELTKRDIQLIQKLNVFNNLKITKYLLQLYNRIKDNLHVVWCDPPPTPEEEAKREAERKAKNKRIDAFMAEKDPNYADYLKYAEKKLKDKFGNIHYRDRYNGNENYSFLLRCC